MSPQIYYVLHVAAVILLTGFTFQAFANSDPARRGRSMMLTGITGAIVLVAGFGLLSKLGYGMTEAWVLIKLACWFGLSALSGIAFKKPEKAGMLSVIASLLIVIAVVAVYVLRGMGS